MDKEQGKDGGGEEGGRGCCGGGRCGCCCCKAIKAVVLLLIGGILGFLIGHCHRGGYCPMSSAPMSAPATK